MKGVIGAASRIDSTSSFVMRSPRGTGPSLSYGDTIRFSPYLDGPLRPGSATVTKVEVTDTADLFVVHLDSPTRSAITGACDRDYVFVEPVAAAADHHATLVAYLLSAVQRNDWHAVWDAAIDLKLLEASRR